MKTDIYSDFHMHSHFSDGSAAVDTMAQHAVRMGLSQISITDHMPLPFATRYAMRANAIKPYTSTIARVRQQFAGTLHIKRGMEVEFLPELRQWIWNLISSQGDRDKNWDHLIASIHHLPAGGAFHLVNGSSLEFTPLLEHYNHDGRALCTAYYRILQEAYSTGWFDSAGHLDVIKKHNSPTPFFDESSPWYRSLLLDTLSSIKENNMTMEINTAGFNHPAGQQYPSAWIIAEAVTMGIDIVLSSDSHSPDTLGQYFAEFAVL
ncbi:MAG: histidinol-phosphatase [Desulfopila sp.]